MIDHSAADIANAGRLAESMLPIRQDWYAKAWRRVTASPRLRKYQEIILADWPEGEDHLRWVVRARVGEIEGWAKRIAKEEDK